MTEIEHHREPADAQKPSDTENDESTTVSAPSERSIDHEEAWTDYHIDSDPILEIENLNVWYGDSHALQDISMDIPPESVTALIGPSGCGKSTFLRCLNRMNDRISEARVEGSVRFEGAEIYEPGRDLVSLRQRIGMVFQEPNPFPKSIRDNVAYGPRKHGEINRGLLARLLGRDDKASEDALIQRCLRQAALWDEVKDRLDDSALSLSGGQQQRLCIARALATDPDVLLMDEPASALDPIATSKIEDLIDGLAEEYTVIVVTHNIQQAARISDQTAVFLTGGQLVEYGDTESIFEQPESNRVEEYITGEFG